ncbi:MAG: hypothetical protein ABSD73_05180 [Candidatus Bathyarchaeia archaeon]|jgi:hypothetical protein
MSKIRKLVGLAIVVVIIGLLLYYAPTIISFVQNPSSSGSSYNAPCTSLTLRDGTSGTNHTTTLDFGDTEYTFEYSIGSYFEASTFIEPYEIYTPHIGDVYRYCGIEIDISKVTSDYISSYIVFLVKPTVQNYMASLHYTKVNITLNNDVAVNISSGLTNETHQYYFAYDGMVSPMEIDGWLEVWFSSQGQKFDAVVGNTITVFNIEIRPFKVQSHYMVIYVKPLY